MGEWRWDWCSGRDSAFWGGKWGNSSRPDHTLLICPGMMGELAMIMNNIGINDIIPPETAGKPQKKPPPPPETDLQQYVALAREWAKTHPVPCLAAAFLAGAVIAWIVKRK